MRSLSERLRCRLLGPAASLFFRRIATTCGCLPPPRAPSSPTVSLPRESFSCANVRTLDGASKRCQPREITRRCPSHHLTFTSPSHDSYSNSREGRRRRRRHRRRRLPGAGLRTRRGAPPSLPLIFSPPIENTRSVGSRFPSTSPNTASTIQTTTGPLRRLRQHRQGGR